MSKVVVDPMCLLGISTYHEKNLPSNFGTSIGILYALQKQLTYKISLSSPLGTNNLPASEIISRLIEYESLKARKAKNNINYYDEYILIGWYVMGSDKAFQKETQKYAEIGTGFKQRGAPYFLRMDLQGETGLFKDGKKVKYSATMETLEKYCNDTMYFQSSKKQTAMSKTLKKELSIIELYNQKLKELQNFIVNCKDDDKRREVQELLQNYERIQHFSSQKKAKVSELINYSILSGLIMGQGKQRQ